MKSLMLLFAVSCIAVGVSSAYADRVQDMSLIARPFPCSDGKTYSVVSAKSLSLLSEKDGLLYRIAAFCADGIVGEINDLRPSPEYVTCGKDDSAATMACYSEFQKLGNILDYPEGQYVKAKFKTATSNVLTEHTASCQIFAPGVASDRTQIVAVAERGTLGHLTDGPFGVDVEGVPNENYRIKLRDSASGFSAEGQIDSASHSGFVQLFNGKDEILASASCKLNN